MFLLNDKIKDLKPYDPEMGDTPVHLDANESFLPLPASFWRSWRLLCPRWPSTATRTPPPESCARPLPPITASRRRAWPRVTAPTS